MSKQERDKLIINLYNRKISIKEISEQVNLSQSAIYQRLHKYKVKLQGQRRTATRYTHDKNYFDAIDTEYKAYWLGFIYADGCISETRGNSSTLLQIGLSFKDRGHLYKFKKDINFTGPIQNYTQGNYKKSILRIRCNYLTNQLKEKGVLPNKSLILKYPSFINKKLQRHFIRGYFDGDGSIAKNLNQITIAGNKQFLDKCQTLFNEELNLTTTKLSKRSNIYQYSKSGRIQITTLLSWLYKDSKISLDRKHKLFKELIHE